MGSPLKTKYTPISFVQDATAFGYLDMACYNCITRSNAYHDGSDLVDRQNALGQAYTEVNARYGNNSGSLGTAAGAGDASFNLFSEQAESWVLPALSENDFIPAGLLDFENIATSYRYRTDAIKRGVVYDYTLEISRNTEGHYTQSISIAIGLVLSSSVYDGSKEIIHKNQYDLLNRLIKSYPVDHWELASDYAYDPQGRIVSTEGPDRGLSETEYDSLGRVRFVRTARQKAKGNDYFSAKVYDDLGREICTGEVTGGHSFESPDEKIPESSLSLRSKVIYGKPSLDSLHALGLGGDNALYTYILNSMTNIRVNDIGAVVAYNESGIAVSLKMSSYDRIGRKKNQWIVYGIGTPAVQLSYSYNISDELTSSSFDEWNGSAWVAKSTRSREYDSRGRLVKTREDGELLASYDRSEKGRISARHYYDRGTPVYTRSVTRDIHGRPLSIGYTKNGQTLYSQSLNYTTPAAAKLAENQQQWNNVPSLGNVLHSNTYDYDELGRLVSADGSLGGSYAYDEAGRLTSKNEDDDLLLIYGGSSYKPSQIGVNGASPVTFHNYDASGNLWLDSKAKVAYRNNARGLPESVRRYSEVPSGITLPAVDDGTVFDEEYANIEMAYDEGGQRIWQRFAGRDRSNRVEATIPGVGVYTKETLLSGFELSRLDLVGGGFRQGTAGVALFPVQDAQGNVRGYADKDGLVSAYGYYPFGTIRELAESASAGKKRWQSKEYDGEHGKYYFGARFFDPYFGLWTSPDPAGQFANPYTYGGDPLNYVDPDGEFVHIIVGAIVGGVIGTASGIAQCSGPGEQSCGKSIAVGNVGGSLVGAAAAATGGAVGAAAGGGLVGGIAGGAAGGAVSGAGGYANNAVATGEDITGEGFVDATWKGGVAGAVGGGVGAYIGPGAFGAMGGGFAGGATGSALNGGDGWEILKGGLMGAGGALASYSMVWGYNNYSGGEKINPEGDDFKGKVLKGADELSTSYEEDARTMLEVRRQEYIDNLNGEYGADMSPHEIEVGGSFRVRSYFWSGKNYLDITEFAIGDETSVGFNSHKGDDFRMHLHTPSRTIEINDAMSGYSKYSVNEHIPSKADVTNAGSFAKHGITSLFSTTNNQIYRIEGNGVYHEIY